MSQTPALEERESVEKLERVKDGHLYCFSFLHASNADGPQPIAPITTKVS